MHILLNGESRELPDASSVAQMLELLGYGARRVAIELNREVVPKSRHGEQMLVEGDRVEIIQAIGGG
ncbi:MAG TPA: sulfur carrier protein ThiS [Arenimonas sp.]|uniref:sulfur carrier protein ThiS n=1 Tax=Arenimonas sp. TaxID=1872635 RepID=UPI002CCE63FC|nr:sulfur carrier protein ThiS [Arenimonas sp.]HMB58157.1 sulfur carrier protein ThiS [Arenimonas sp.]